MNCPVCKSNKFETFSWGKAKIEFCRSCSLYFSNDHSDKVQYYKTNYRIDSTDEFENNFRRLSLIPQYYKLVQQIKNYLPQKAQILDYGCSNGLFIDEIRRYGFSCFGVEINEVAKKYAQAIGIEVKSELKDFNITFDAITFWHSLEHLTAPKEVLKYTHHFLKNDGYIFIRVPNFDCLWSKLLKDRWIWFQPQNHISHFTVESLKKLLESSNFQIIHAKEQRPNNFQTFLFFLLSILVTLKKLSIKFIIRKTIAKMIEWITGSEIFVIAKKL